MSVAGLSASLRDGIRREARQLLAADLAVRGNQPHSAGGPDGDRRPPGRPPHRRQGDGHRRRRSRRQRPAGPQPARRAQGRWTASTRSTASSTCARPRPLHELLTPGTAVVAADLLSHWKLKVGDSLQIGGQPFRVAASVLAEPDRVGISFTIGPRVFLSGAGFARTHLEDQGSRMGYRTLVRLPDGISNAALDAAAERLKQVLPGGESFRVETYRQAQPSLRQNISPGGEVPRAGRPAVALRRRHRRRPERAGVARQPDGRHRDPQVPGDAPARDLPALSRADGPARAGRQHRGDPRRRGRADDAPPAVPRPHPARADPPLAAGRPAARPGPGNRGRDAVQPAAALGRAARAAGPRAAPRRRAPPPPPLGHGGDLPRPGGGDLGDGRPAVGLPRAGGAVHRRRGGGDGGARRRRLPGLLGGPPAAARRLLPPPMAAARHRRPRPARRRGERRHRRPRAWRARRPRHVARRAAHHLPAREGAARRRAERLPGGHPAGPVAGRRAAPPSSGGRRGSSRCRW